MEACSGTSMWKRVVRKRGASSGCSRNISTRTLCSSVGMTLGRWHIPYRHETTGEHEKRSLSGVAAPWRMSAELARKGRTVGAGSEGNTSRSSRSAWTIQISCNVRVMPTSRYALSFAGIAAGLVACGGAEPPPMRSPAAPPAPLVPVVTATAAPASVAQMFAEGEPEMVFTDPDRRKKIESAFSSIDALVDEEVRAQRLPGVAFGVVVDGELAYAKGFGVTDLVTKAKPDADTVYRIGLDHEVVHRARRARPPRRGRARARRSAHPLPPRSGRAGVSHARYAFDHPPAAPDADLGPAAPRQLRLHTTRSRALRRRGLEVTGELPARERAGQQLRLF